MLGRNDRHRLEMNDQHLQRDDPDLAQSLPALPALQFKNLRAGAQLAWARRRRARGSAA